jgi:uncharacterized protein YcfJ
LQAVLKLFVTAYSLDPEDHMNKIFGHFIFGGLLVGAMFGLIGAGGGNALMGIGVGALAGAFIGWFIAAAVLEQKKKEK